jgi:hypothetical protein
MKRESSMLGVRNIIVIHLRRLLKFSCSTKSRLRPGLGFASGWEVVDQ